VSPELRTRRLRRFERRPDHRDPSPTGAEGCRCRRREQLAGGEFKEDCNSHATILFVIGIGGGDQQ
jgi:hypothetical protein